MLSVNLSVELKLGAQKVHCVKARCSDEASIAQLFFKRGETGRAYVKIYDVFINQVSSVSSDNVSMVRDYYVYKVQQKKQVFVAYFNCHALCL